MESVLKEGSDYRETLGMASRRISQPSRNIVSRNREMRMQQKQSSVCPATGKRLSRFSLRLSPEFKNRLKALPWWIVLILASILAGFYFKHPNLYFLRSAETPALVVLACIGAWFASRARRLATGTSGRVEATLRLLLSILLLCLVVGQEGWFRWQQYQVFRGGAALSHIGQHFVVGFTNFEDLKPLAERGLIGGIYVTKRNQKGETLESLRDHISELQALRAKEGLPPLFVMADQEGGRVSHLSPLVKRMPSLSSVLGDSTEGLEERARAYGEEQGRLLADVGVNMNLAPVVDLKINPSGHWVDIHTRIDKRGISSDPWTVARVATAYGQGLASRGVQPTAKHFPGLGRVQADTHYVQVSRSYDAVEQAADWLPFREVTAHAGAAMMLSHVRLSNIDPDHPASLSRAVVQDMLRKQDGEGWNFQGLLITDDLNMGAVYGEGIGKAAATALDAGVDLLLVSYDPDQYYRAIYTATKAWRHGKVNGVREAESKNRLIRYWKQKQEGAEE